MKLKELQKIFETAPTLEAEIYIPGIQKETTTQIGYNFDDLGNLELYEISS